MTSVSALTGQTMCEQTGWASDSSLSCITPHDGGRSQRLSMTAGGAVGSVSRAVSTDVEVCGMSAANRASTGSSSVTLYGAGLGLTAPSVWVSWGRSSCEGTEWSSDSAVRSMVGLGAHGSERVRISVAEVTASLSGGQSFDADHVSAGLVWNGMSTGSVSVTLYGGGMARGDHSSTGRREPTACEATGWVSDSCVVCSISLGITGSRHVKVSAGAMIGSVSEGLSVTGPQLSVSASRNMLSTGSASITLTGADLGLHAVTVSMSSGWTVCELSLIHI